MRISDMIGICWRNLVRRKLRTALTAFGVVIGVCAILVMISIGIGLEQYYTEMMKSWGDLTIINVQGYNSKTKLDDAAIAKMQALEGVDIATPLYQNWNMSMQITAKKGRYQAWAQIIGVYPEAVEKLGFKLGSGSYLKEDDKGYSLVIGSEFGYRFRDTKRKPGRGDRVDPYPDKNGVIKKPFVDPTKDKMTLMLQPQKDGAKPIEIKLNVAGIMEKDDNNWESSNAVFIDINKGKVLQDKYNKASGLPKAEKLKYDEVRVKCLDMDMVAGVQEKIKAMGFECWSMEDSRKSMQDSARMIQMVLGGLAGISLFVAAIGIANTMVMSIIERTREIGIMKVIGAEVGNIRVMFLMEAGMIGLLGGIVGVGLSYGVSAIINKLAVGGFGGQGGTMSVIPPWLVAFALFFSILVGVIFGFLPANRAVKISALEAIKHD
ncbi:MAG: ABC transporter permease [Angelakisella sp.]